MEKRNRRLPTVFLVMLLIALSLFGVYQFKRAEDLRLAVENQYTHAFHELTEYVSDIDVLLKKAMLVQDAGQISSLSAEIYMQSAAAKANLAMLPTGEINLSETARFLSQTADYTEYLSTKAIRDGDITEEEYQNLQSLSGFAGRVKEHVTKLDDQLYFGQLSFEKTKNFTVHAEDTDGDFAGGMEAIEKAFQDYPSLIYDGPFSEHVESLQPAFLEGRRNVSQNGAMDAAKAILGKERSLKLQFSGEGNGTVPTFDFTSENENGRTCSVSVSQKGGQVVYMLDSRSVTESKLTAEDAVTLAGKFLLEKDFVNMKPSYYERTGNTVTVNFAAVQKDVVLYSDLVKVKVALDNGEILGLETMGYLMNHKVRVFPSQLLSEENIRSRVSPHLELESVRLALIPLESKREVLTYECRGTFEGDRFLLYINAETGVEEKILMLIETENGTLTV
ncbi:MAG: germination protein YpeB [Clostridia bacterium]|nr:germination protein YpeB [Clostridia bacterium]